MRAALANAAGVPSRELATAAKEGTAPSPDLIRKLAPALGFHTADLFVIAGLPVPDDVIVHRTPSVAVAHPAICRSGPTMAR